jgi:hypothetical protein
LGGEEIRDPSPRCYTQRDRSHQAAKCGRLPATL